MFRKSLSVAILGLAVSAPLFVLGCASENGGKPYSVTGTNTIDDQERKEKLRWTDDKGRYRPDLRNQGGAPLRQVQ